MLIPVMTAGPKEPTADELQFYLKQIVDQLIPLYTRGILIKMPLYQNGTPADLSDSSACIGVVCDHPVAVKMCGFGDHGHSILPCTQCTVTQEEMFSDPALCNECKLQRHLDLAQEYAILTDPAARKGFAKVQGVRWYEFTRLSYFNPSTMTIIDPMHNLLIGMSCLIIKNHWYALWIASNTLRGNTGKTKRELHVIHSYLDS
ncbi:hypothetical protein JB92DRAFT_2799839, partial [Gautieria morchelliformis]